MENNSRNRCKLPTPHTILIPGPEEFKLIQTSQEFLVKDISKILDKMGYEGLHSESSMQQKIELTNLIQQGSEHLMSSPAPPTESSSIVEHTICIPSCLKPLRLPDPRSDACIHRVPRNLREVKPEAYTPQLVSIGPIHHDDPNLRGMKNYKWSYLHKLCTESRKQTDELWREVQLREREIRSYYEESFEEVIDSLRFIEMVLLDSAFVIMIIRAKYIERNRKPTEGKVPHPPDDSALSKAWRDYGITRDLMLLENQLPYFVLHHLYTFAFGSESSPPFDDLACEYFQTHAVRPALDERQLCTRCFLRPARVDEKKHFELVKDEVRRKAQGQHRHFTDLIRMFWSYKLQPKDLNDYSHYLGYVANKFTISKLHDARVKFEMDHEAWPLKLKSKKQVPLRRVLIMPQVLFHDGSECLIRNLMAYEQCHGQYDAYICDFFVFLSYLINTEKDVELLAEAGIITNQIGDNAAVANIVKGFGTNIAMVGTRYHSIYTDLNAHCENGFYKTVAILRRVYFTNLWKASGTIGAILVVILTIVQTINSFRQLK